MEPEDPSWYRVPGVGMVHTTSGEIKQLDIRSEEIRAHINQRMQELAAKRPKVELQWTPPQTTPGRISMKKEGY